jgi:hypothetical protein
MKGVCAMRGCCHAWGAVEQPYEVRERVEAAELLC